MSTQPITVPGLSSPVIVTSNLWTGKQTVMVGGRAAEITGKGTYALPTADGGTVEGKLGRSTLINPFPTLEVAGVQYATGPEIPVALRVLTVAPILLIALGALLGGVIAVGAILVNYSIARSTRPVATKTVLMLLILVAAFGTWVILVALLVR